MKSGGALHPLGVADLCNLCLLVLVLNRSSHGSILLKQFVFNGGEPFYDYFSSETPVQVATFLQKPVQGRVINMDYLFILFHAIIILLLFHASSTGKSLLLLLWVGLVCPWRDFCYHFFACMLSWISTANNYWFIIFHARIRFASLFFLITYNLIKYIIFK